MEDEEYDPTPKIRPTRVAKRSHVPYSGELPVRLIPKTYQKPVRQFSPIHNIDGYVWSAGLTGEKEEEIRRKYTPKPEPQKIVEEIKHVPSDMLHVFSAMKVLKNGEVRIKFTVPMEPVYEYQKKGKMAPIEVRLRCAKAFGYPDSVLEKMLARDDYMKKNKNNLDEFINTIFGKSILTKTSKPKVKSIMDALTSKFKRIKM
jgi:hypothetical protein